MERLAVNTIITPIPCCARDGAYFAARYRCALRPPVVLPASSAAKFSQHGSIQNVARGGPHKTAAAAAAVRSTGNTQESVRPLRTVLTQQVGPRGSGTHGPALCNPGDNHLT